MAKVEDVARYENSVTNTWNIATGSFKEIQDHFNAIESAMMEEFGCKKEELINLPRDAALGPKATAALESALQSSFRSPMNLHKAMNPESY